MASKNSKAAANTHPRIASYIRLLGKDAAVAVENILYQPDLELGDKILESMRSALKDAVSSIFILRYGGAYRDLWAEDPDAAKHWAEHAIAMATARAYTLLMFASFHPSLLESDGEASFTLPKCLAGTPIQNRIRGKMDLLDILIDTRRLPTLTANGLAIEILQRSYGLTRSEIKTLDAAAQNDRSRATGALWHSFTRIIKDEVETLRLARAWERRPLEILVSRDFDKVYHEYSRLGVSSCMNKSGFNLSDFYTEAGAVMLDFRVDDQPAGRAIGWPVAIKGTVGLIVDRIYWRMPKGIDARSLYDKVYGQLQSGHVSGHNILYYRHSDVGRDPHQNWVMKNTQLAIDAGLPSAPPSGLLTQLDISAREPYLDTYQIAYYDKHAHIVASESVKVKLPAVLHNRSVSEPKSDIIYHRPAGYSHLDSKQYFGIASISSASNRPMSMSISNTTIMDAPIIISKNVNLEPVAQAYQKYSNSQCYLARVVRDYHRDPKQQSIF